jgi:hypothetical protein
MEANKVYAHSTIIDAYALLHTRVMQIAVRW